MIPSMAEKYMFDKICDFNYLLKLHMIREREMKADN